jgi:hypothetical protein
VDNISLYDFFKMLSSRSDTYDKMVSNCHGDLTLGNIIGGKCIDSNHHVGEWNSWLLDVSKLAQSVHYDYEHMFSDDVVSVS